MERMSTAIAYRATAVVAAIAHEKYLVMEDKAGTM